MRRLERIVNIQRQWCRLVSSTPAAISTISKNAVKNGVKKKEEEKDWKSELLKILEVEHKQKKRGIWRQRVKQIALADIVRFTLRDDLQSLVRLTENQLRSRATQEIVPICLLVLNKKFEKILRKTDSIESTSSLSLFIGISELWKSIKRSENNTTSLVAILLLSNIRKWKDQRKFDAKSWKTIEDLFDEMQRKMALLAQNVRISDQQLEVFIGTEDLKSIQKEVDQIRKFYIPLGRNLLEKMRYLEDLELVAPLQGNCSSEEYRMNPFQVDGIEKSNYKRLFEDHLNVESSMWIHVKNTVGEAAENNNAVSGEDLISEWDWKRRIRDGLRKIDPNDTHPIVSTCLELLPREKLVETLHFSALSACSQGQNLIGASQFQFDVLEPILKELGNAFKKEMGYDENEIWKRVFATYIDYFSDSEISRQNTHREWWNKSCKTQGITSDFQFEMGNMDSETRNEVCNVLINVIFDSCLFPYESKDSKVTWQRAFSYRSISIEEESKVSTDGRLSLSRMLSINSKLMGLFDKNPFNFIVFSTSNLPMIVPPRPWIDRGTGGPLYTTSQHEIIRKMMEFRAVRLNEEMRARITSQAQARPVFDALNQLGSTPWVINEPMLDVLKDVFGRSGNSESRGLLEKLEIPMRHDTFDIPDFGREFGIGIKKEDVDVEKFRSYAKKKAEAIKMRNESNSLWCWMQYRVVLADHFRGQTLFFPHNMDFRGRVYPLSPYLSHMGDDVNRCILKFAKSQKLGEKGFDWLKLHCINLTGTMKRSSVADRMVEAERLIPLMLDSARDPLNGQKWWMSSDEPWQTLAACVEIENATRYGSDVALFPSQLPIHQDGSCNGLQHYAALGRDNEGGVQVNLTQSDTPNDVYSDVAQRVEQKRQQDEQSNGEDCDVARKLREALPQNVPRKVIKQTVMTTVYGVTMYGAVLQIKRQLKAMDIPGEDAAIFARYLARKTFASLNDAFTSSMALKDWFRLIAKGSSDLMKTVEWITPLGLPVVQPYCKLVERKGKLILAPVPMKQVDAFPPNFVHSLDSTHMMLTSLNCAQRGITFAAVHDCFWTHANSVDQMNEICRQQFVSLHSQPIVEQCSEWFKKTYLTPKMAKILPEKDFQKYSEIFTANIEHGDLDIEKVKDSVYFFS
ncbi:DNA-directed RNA polymerase [Caenorhabditis elegans]|uniref:DNA-directed RNA polymerase n=2 Tax=Caenorhabditis elegans TaxID=6239 RepID=Q8WQA3_CAEEL|nr:DNA-directed RNA polymerase [Caenorhabditis elegans]CAD21670.3 DNA-directed RNA polymerase [Caenorhabditis elegans]|eukprot:NP_001122531.1 DNA-directed RNA polymerase [Caenorhabditis elegans]